MAFHLLPVESIGEGLKRLAREESGGVVRDLAGKKPDRGTAIHEARKHIRRMRALLRVIKDSLDEQYQVEVEAYRRAGQILSRYRDADVMIASFERLASTLEKKLNPELHARFGDYLRKRSENIAAEGEGIDQAIQEVVELMNAAGRRLVEWPLDDCDFSTIGHALHESYRRTRRAFRGAMDDRRELAYHDWRKESRVLRYQVTMIELCWPEFFHGYRKSLEHLANLLGESHDLSLLAPVALDTAAMPGAEEDVQLLLEEIERRQSLLRIEAEGLGRRLFTGRFSEIGDRFERYWRIWCREGFHPELEISDSKHG